MNYQNLLSLINQGQLESIESVELYALTQDLINKKISPLNLLVQFLPADMT